MAHFDSVRNALPAGSDSLRRGQLVGIITLLGAGAPVRPVRIEFSGHTGTFSAVGAYEVNDDIGGHPTDSTYLLFAWGGADRDSLVSVNVSAATNGLVVTDGSSVTSSEFSSGSAVARGSSGTCTSYASRMPPDIVVPSGLACRLETTVVSDGGVLIIEIGEAQYDLPAQALSGLRLEGQFRS